jgi:hypothetical protein
MRDNAMMPENPRKLPPKNNSPNNSQIRGEYANYRLTPQSLRFIDRTSKRSKQMTKYSTNQISRINQALNETRDALARAMAYRFDLRDMEIIEFYTHHIAKLEAMLAD